MSFDWLKRQNGTGRKNIGECHQALLNAVGGVWAQHYNTACFD